MMLVTLAQARDHLRIDTVDDETDLTLKIQAASAAVVTYLKSAADDFLDTSGQPVLDSSDEIVGVPYQVTAAVLIMLGVLYKERDGEVSESIEAQYGYGYLPKAVVSLLCPLRDPACA